MESRLAFEAIKTALASCPDTHVMSAEYDEEFFGNFVIAFSKDRVPLSLVLDRGELIICRGLNASHDCRTVLPAIYDAEETDLLTAIANSI